MCYLVAKDRDAHGCFALKTTHGKHLVELKRELNKAVGYKGVQLVTISRPTAYGRVRTVSFCGYRARVSDSCKRDFVHKRGQALLRKSLKIEIWIEENYHP